MTALQEVGIAINDDHRVVHDHSQYEDESSQRNGIQLNTSQVHHAYTDRGADRQSRCRYKGRTQRKEQQHDGDHDQNGDHDVAKE